MADGCDRLTGGRQVVVNRAELPPRQQLACRWPSSTAVVTARRPDLTGPVTFRFVQFVRDLGEDRRRDATHEAGHVASALLRGWTVHQAEVPLSEPPYTSVEVPDLDSEDVQATREDVLAVGAHVHAGWVAVRLVLGDQQADRDTYLTDRQSALSDFRRSRLLASRLVGVDGLPETDEAVESAIEEFRAEAERLFSEPGVLEGIQAVADDLFSARSGPVAESDLRRTFDARQR